MINFKAKKLRQVADGHVLTLSGNDGEEMLAIFMVWGQDRKTNLVVVSASVDDAIKVLVTSGKRLILASVIATLDRVIEKWSTQGLKPTVPEREYLTKQRKKVLDRIASYCENGVFK